MYLLLVLFLCTMTATPTILPKLLWEGPQWVQCHKIQQSISVFILIVLLVPFVIISLILWYNLFFQSLQALLHVLGQIDVAFLPFYWFVLNFSHSNEGGMISSCGFNCIFLVTNEFEHLFMCFLTICMYLLKCFLMYFLIGLFFFYF